MTISTRRRIIEIIALVAALAIFGGLFYLVQVYYAAESDSRTEIQAGALDREDRVRIRARALQIDPVRGDMFVRLDFRPEGAYAGAGGVPDRNLRLYVNSEAGRTEVTFPRGQRMSPTDVTLSLVGYVSDYPFDDHEARLELYMTAPRAPDQPFIDQEPVAIIVDFLGFLPGYVVAAEPLPTEATNAPLVIELDISRSYTVLIFAVFVIVATWLIVISAVTLTTQVLFRNRKLEAGYFALMVALLFALPAFRNNVPGAPPIGVYSDFLSFFWGMGFAVLCLVTLIVADVFKIGGAKT